VIPWQLALTKAMSNFRQSGYLIQEGSDELLLREGLTQLQRGEETLPVRS
jgi:hypothetical protein